MLDETIRHQCIYISLDGVPVTVYKPVSCDGLAAPTILVYFHGGGHVVGNRKSHETVCKILARLVNQHKQVWYNTYNIFLVFVILVVGLCFFVNFIPQKMDENITGQKNVLLNSIIQRKELIYICNRIDLIDSY